jgi:hypothetical protein
MTKKIVFQKKKSFKKKSINFFLLMPSRKRKYNQTKNKKIKIKMKKSKTRKKKYKNG